MKKKNIIISTAALLILAGAGLWIFGGRKAEKNIDFATATVQKGNVSNSITATGTIEPVTEVQVGTQVSGIIDKIYVDYNTVVKAGQVIAEMDRVTLLNDLQSAQASYNGNEAEYHYQQKLFERYHTLHEKQLISDTEYEQYEYNYRRAKSAYEQSKALLDKAKQNLSYTTITSPIDGVVTSRQVEAGQTVASGFSTPTLFTIAADLTQMQVVADIDEADIAGVKEGARVTFTVDAYPDDVFEGEVKQVRLGSTNSSSSSTETTETVVTYEVVISADNPDLKLKPRLTANVTVYTDTRENVLTVPNKALRFHPDEKLAGNRPIHDCDAPKKLWRLDEKGWTAIPVKTGLSDGANTEIVSGIKEGDSIVTEAVIKSQAGPAAPQETEQEQSPFMPGPRDKKK